MNPVHTDESGLSPDSLRGSQHFIQATIIGDSKGTDIMGNQRTRDELSANEVEALRQNGQYVNPDGSPITDRDVILTLAPPSVVDQMRNNIQVQQPTTSLPDGGWVWRDGEYMWRGLTPPSSPPPGATVNAPSIAPVDTSNEDAVKAFTDRVHANTQPLLDPNDAPIQVAETPQDKPNNDWHTSAPLQAPVAPAPPLLSQTPETNL